MSEAVTEFEEINIDVTDVDAWDGESGAKVPPGTYVLLIAGAKKDTSKSSGGPVVVIDFEVAQEGPYLGVKFKRSYSLQQSALGRWKQLVVACRAPLSGTTTQHLIGAYIVADIIHKPSNKTQAPNPDGSVPAPKMMMDVLNEQPVEEDAPAADAGQQQAAASTAAAPAPAAQGPWIRRS